MAVDINQMRQQYASQLAQQQQQAMRGVQDVYAQRGTTGSGSEAKAFGDLGSQFGAAAGAQEAGLQQYLGQLQQQQDQMNQQESQFGRQLGQQQSQFGQSLAEQQAQRTQQGNQFGQSLAEQQAQRAQQGSQFGQSLAEQLASRLQQGQQFGQQLGQQESQFGRTLGMQQQQFDFNKSLGEAGLTGMYNGKETMQGQQFQQGQAEQEQMNALAQQLGYPNAAAMMFGQASGNSMDVQAEQGFRTPTASSPYTGTRGLPNGQGMTQQGLQTMLAKFGFH